MAGMTAIERGILFSHASHAVGDSLVTGGFRSEAAAQVHAETVCRASPGIEYESMTRRTGGHWLSVAGRAAQEVVGRRWSV